jgi:hypothetical protein
MRGTTALTLWIVRTVAIAVCWVLLSEAQHVQAGSVIALTLKAAPTIENGGPNPNGTSTDYDGTWMFNVSTNDNMITFKIVGANNEDNTKEYSGDTYTYKATVKDGVYTFSGTAPGTKPPASLYNLGMAGTYDSNKNTLSLTLAPGSYPIDKFPLPKDVTGTLTSQLIKNPNGEPAVEYYVIKIASVPEPSSAVLGLIALVTLAAASTLNRLSKSMKGKGC